MNIFEKIKDFFTPKFLDTQIIQIDSFVLYLMDRRKIENMRKNGAGINTITRGLADIPNRKIYVEYDDKGIMPEFEILGHELCHLIYGNFHK